MDYVGISRYQASGEYKPKTGASLRQSISSNCSGISIAGLDRSNEASATVPVTVAVFFAGSKLD